MAEYLLEAAGLNFTFTQRPVVRGVSLLARRGEIISVLGPNGSGKSTLLRLLMGHLKGSGTIKWLGTDLHAWSGKRLAQKLAFLPQHPTLLQGQTVLQAVALGRYPHLGLLGLESPHDERTTRDAATALGLEAVLGSPVEALSGGQRQRVFLARCLAQEPAALLLDEPDTFLDLKHTALLASILRRLARERSLTILLATHNLHLAGAIADRVLLLEDGQPVAEGAPRAVLTAERIQATYGIKAIPWERGPDWGLGIVY